MKFYIEEFYEVLSNNSNDDIIQKQVRKIKLVIPSFKFRLLKILKYPPPLHIACFSQYTSNSNTVEVGIDCRPVAKICTGAKVPP